VDAPKVLDCFFGLPLAQGKQAEVVVGVATVGVEANGCQELLLGRLGKALGEVGVSQVVMCGRRTRIDLEASSKATFARAKSFS